MTTFAIQHASEIQDGPSFIIHANHLTDNFTAIISDFSDRLSKATASAQTVAGAVTFSSGVTCASALTVAGRATFTGLSTFSIASASIPVSPVDGSWYYDATTFLYNAVIGGVVRSFDPGSFPHHYRGSGSPVYVSSSTFTVPYICSRDVALGSGLGGGNISKATSSTIDISTNALNGCAQSAALAGTIGTGGVSTTIITGSSTTFSTDFIVGDVIWTAGAARRITAIASATSLTVESVVTIANGTSYKRGGEAPSTWYNVYEVYDIFGSGNTGIYLDTRNAAAGHTLSNFSTYLYNQMPFAVRNDSSSNIWPFSVASWGRQPLILLRGTTTNVNTPVAGTLTALNSGVQTSYTSVDLGSFMPSISTLAYLNVVSGSSSDVLSIRTDSGTANDYTVGRSGGSAVILPTTSTQGIEYKRVAGAAGQFIDVLGFYVNGVP